MNEFDPMTSLKAKKLIGSLELVNSFGVDSNNSFSILNSVCCPKFPRDRFHFVKQTGIFECW